MQRAVRVEASPDRRACIVSVRAQPGAKRTGAAGAWNGMLKVAVAAPAEDGRANEELVRVLARILGLRANAIRLVSGERSRAKRFRIEADPDVVAAKLAEILAEGA